MAVGDRTTRQTRRGLPLTVSIFTILVLAVGAVAGLLTAHSFLEARNTTRAIGTELLTVVGSRTAAEVRRLVESTSALADLAARLPEVARAPDLQQHAAGPFLAAALNTYPSIYSAYMGFADGRFYQLISLNAEQGRARDVHRAPPEARLLQRVILPRADGGRMELWSFLDADSRIVGSRVIRETAYDPRNRPWYRMAADIEELVGTPIYVFSSLGLPGVSVARRFDGPVAGVFGVDLTVGDLSEFLERQRVTPNTQLAVIAYDGTILAMPGLIDVMEARRGPDGAIRALTSADLNNPVLSAAAATLTDNLGVSRVTVEGEPFLMDVRRIADGADFGLRVLVAAPEADFVQPLLRMRDRGLLFAAGVLALALPLAYVLSRRMARALTQLSNRAESIRRLDLVDQPPVDSFVREIHALATAMTTMTASLRTFGLYVPKALVGQIVRGGGDVELGGSRHEVTLMFTDVAGFTTLSEQTPPEDLLIRTSMLFEEIDIAVSQHSGIIDKFIGDAVMAVWNVPQPVPNHARRACLAALEAERRVAIFNQELTANGFPPMPTRFGVHTGCAVVGNVGSSDRMNYTAVGAAVNLAARLEGLNKVFGTRVLASRATIEQAGEGFVARWLDTVLPKGVLEPVDVFALDGLTAEAAAREDMPAVSDAEADYARRWNAAQILLRHDRAFAAAASAFAALAAERPDDRLAREAAENAAALAANPPAAWSGVLAMSEK